MMPYYRGNVFDYAPALKGESSNDSFQVRCFRHCLSKLSSDRILPNPKRSSSAGRATVLSSPPTPACFAHGKKSSLNSNKLTSLHKNTLDGLESLRFL